MAVFLLCFSIFRVGNSGFLILKVGYNYKGEYDSFFICIVEPKYCFVFYPRPFIEKGNWRKTPNKSGGSKNSQN